ncbi:hypothetical protein [Aquirufa ecclesiirivi]|nr:hypothetical protein [Aquirufa ecclesiirivi]MDF0693078.1 hypothetical protein [Aquirufa ecclesiirivi]
MENVEKNTSQVEVKEAWAKPELELVSVKENTLGAFGVGGDAGVFS